MLCAFFSVATISEQFPVGEEAAVQVAGQVRALGLAKGATVLVAAGDQPTDAPFATLLEKELGGDFRVVGIAKGEPRGAREVLAGLAASRRVLDVVACTQSAAGWLVFSDMASDFPGLGTPRLVAPRSHRWPNFLKAANLLNIANQIAVIAILAIGMTVVIITGGIDLSVGSLLALSAVLSARFIRDLAGGVQATAAGMVLSCLGAIVLCGAAGLFSGAMITRFRIPPFIVTLAMMLVGSGLAYTLAEGQSVYQVPDAFTWLGRGADLFGLPNAVVLMLALYAAAHVLMSRMRLGRYFYGVGGNSEAARLSGVPVQRVLMLAYLGSALLAGLGGVIMASQLRSGCRHRVRQGPRHRRGVHSAHRRGPRHSRRRAPRQAPSRPVGEAGPGRRPNVQQLVGTSCNTFTVCGIAPSTNPRQSTAPAGLPGRQMIKAGPTAAARHRDRMALGVKARLRIRMTSPNPGISRSAMARTASGVTSRRDTPVPPVVRTR